MKNWMTPIVVSVFCIALAVSNGSAEGWKLNPFSDDTTPKGPSIWTKMNNSTKSAWGKTKSAMTPWKKKPAPPPASPLIGQSKKYSGSPTFNGGKEEPKGNWFTNMFKSKPKEEPPRTANEWLKSPRPKF